MEKEALSKERDRVSNELFGVVYTSISEWGKIAVDALIITANKGVEPPIENNLELRVANLEDQLEQARLENMDLWEENEEMKLEMLKMKKR